MNFRKSIALLTALLMLVSNAGFALTVHYCGGKMASISSGFSNEETCEVEKLEVEKACCAKDPSDSELVQQIQTNHKKCCTDKTLEFKGKMGDILAKSSTEMATPFMVPTFRVPVFTAVDVVQTEKLPSYYCDAHAPPLFKLYHQYLLYA